MRDLTAQVTSSLLPFPGVTIEALGEDEITLDSVLHGKFALGRSGFAWLACGPQLEVVHAVTGERLSAYCFSGGGEHPPSVLAARDFSWLKRSGLLVGLEEVEGSILCLYDLGLSRVVKAVVIPGRITAIEPLVSYGGASTSTQHLHQSLRWFFGIAAVVTDLGHVLLVDLCLDDLSCSQSELEASDLEVVTKSPAEIPRLREVSSGQGRHLCLQLSGPSGTATTALQYISRTNQLAVGFSNGYLQLWNMKTLKKEYHSQLEGGRVPVYAFTFQEPENDPRNCCYLWAVQSAQDMEGDIVSLHLLQLAFSERNCLASGKIMYEGLEYCEERYSQEVSGAAFPLRAQTTNTRLLSCQTIEKFRPHPDRDDSVNEVASPDTSVSIFSWQVKAYGQGSPCTYIGVFDINRWYHAQMPDSLRSGESLHSCPYFAVWSLDPVVEMVSPRPLLDVVVHDRSLSRGLPFTCPPPEQFFNPTTYNFDATCLLNSGIVHLTCSGYQKETLGFLKKAAPCSSEVISSSYTRCLMSGLLSSRLSDSQLSSLSQEEQLDAILSTAVETSSLGLITGCIKQWTAEEQPGSALNLRYILEWAWNKVVNTKEELDGICAPLFDNSSNFTDPQTLQLLQRSQRLLGNLSSIFHCLLSEAQELTQRGLVGLMNKNMVSSLISQYAQVVLWFCRTGLLPEGSDEDALQISRPFYSHSVVSNYYTIRREELIRLAKGKWCADCLMIDGLVAQCGERLVNLWKRDAAGTGLYPPPTLHALLDGYLLENIDEATKHAIVIYLLLDVMYAFPNKGGASVESFPTAFAIPIGLVKLVQGLWLLDHRDHQSSVELLLHPATSQCHFTWQHERVLQALMIQGQHTVALRYFHVTKPPLSSVPQAKLCLSVLLHNRCLVDAWSLLRQHSSRLNMEQLLAFMYESCQELGLIKEMLKLPLGLSEQECLEKFLQATGGLQNRELLMVHYLQQANYIPALQLNHSLKMNLVNERDPKLKERANTRNSILDQYSKVLPRVQRKLAMERAKPYQHPSTIHREVSRPQPLSTIAKRSANDKVMSKAGFISNLLTKIEEVWLGKGASPQPSPVKSPKAADMQSPLAKPLAVSEPFLGTPITMTAKRKSRLLDLVVHPSCQTPKPLLSPPRPLGSWAPPKSVGKAPELSLLQTPQVVKRARALAASGPVFTAFTPQSILRSSLRPTPVATPSASPGRSITPPLRNKESRITFIEESETLEPEKATVPWSNGMAADSEISLLTRGPLLSRTTRQTWTQQPPEEDLEDKPHVKFMPPEGGIPSPQLRGIKNETTSSTEVVAETKSSELPPGSLPGRFSLGLEASHTSAPSADTTMEYCDAPLPEELERELLTRDDDDVVVVNIKGRVDEESPKESCANKNEQGTLLTEEVVVLEQSLDQEPQIEQQGLVESAHHKGDDLTVDEEEPGPNQVCNQDVGEVAVSEPHTVEPTESPELAVQAEEPPQQVLGHTTDGLKLVEQHLSEGLSPPPLSRSGIHEPSQTSAAVSSAPVCGAPEEQQAVAVEGPPTLTSQKSVGSVTSSEHTGTDSHSVVSVDDSEELSSQSEEEEESDSLEEEEEEEEEDSGSEVEIIEEVQGNGRLPPHQPEVPSPLLVDERDTPHYLPVLSEQDAAGLSLVTPETEQKMEGEVVMVRLGMGDGMEAVEAATCYTELKPSTTLLVPLELVEGQEDGLEEDALLGLTDLRPASEQEGLSSGAQSNFSLMLEVEEDGDEEPDTLPMENDLQTYFQPEAQEASGDPVEEPHGIFMGTDDLESPLFGEVSPQDQVTEKDTLDDIELEGLTETDMQTPESSSPEHYNQPHSALPCKYIEADYNMVEAEEHSVTAAGDHHRPEATPDCALEQPSAAPDEEQQPSIEPEAINDLLLLQLVEEAPEAIPDCPEMEQPSAAPEEEQQPSSEPEAINDVLKLQLVEEAPEATPDCPEVEQPSAAPEEEEQQSSGEPEAINYVLKLQLVEKTPEATPDCPEVEQPSAAPEEEQQPSKEPEAVKDTAVEEAAAEEVIANTSSVNDLVSSAEGNGTVNREEPECAPALTSSEAVSAEQQLNGEELADAGEENREADVLLEERKKPTNETNGEEEPEVNQQVVHVVVSECQTKSAPQPELEAATPSRRGRQPPSTPTRRTTRGRKAVTVTSSLQEAGELEEARVEEKEPEPQVPASPSRGTRRSRQVQEAKVGTPRRSSRSTQPEPPKEEADATDDASLDPVSSRLSTPAKRSVSQRSTPTRSSRRTRGTTEVEAAMDAITEEEEDVNNMDAATVGAEVPTPAKRRNTQGATPKRASRRTTTSNEELLQTRTEEPEQEVSVPPNKAKSRKTRSTFKEAQPILLEVEEEDEGETQPLPSPARGTRASSRVSLNLYPQVKLYSLSPSRSTRKTRRSVAVEKANQTDERSEEAPPITSSRRPTRSKLWNHPEEDLPLLDTPLEVNSETPVADALIKRLQDEEEKREGGAGNDGLRANNGSTKSSVGMVPSSPSEEDLNPVPDNDQSLSVAHSFIYSPSRRRTRASRADSLVQEEVSLPPVTRKKKNTVTAAAFLNDQDEEVEDAVAFSKTRSSRRTAKPKAALAARPIVNVDLISPLSSPAEAVSRVQKRVEEGSAPSSRMALRRKRIMDIAFTKPVTRRKKL